CRSTSGRAIDPASVVAGRWSSSTSSASTTSSGSVTSSPAKGVGFKHAEHGDGVTRIQRLACSLVDIPRQLLPCGAAPCGRGAFDRVRRDSVLPLLPELKGDHVVVLKLGHQGSHRWLV